MPKVSEEQLRALETRPGENSALRDLCADLREARSEISKLRETAEKTKIHWDRWKALAEKLSDLALKLAEGDQAGARTCLEEIAEDARSELARLREDTP